MIKRGLQFFIISCFAYASLVLFSLFVLPSIKEISSVFEAFKKIFLTAHCLFYGLIYFGWPKAIAYIAKKQRISPSEAQYQKALQGRYYLLGILIVLELLHWMSK